MADKCKSCIYKHLAEFKRPTIEELKAYADSIGWKTFDAEYFYWKHEQGGWLIPVGKQLVPMVNWHGAVQVWYRAALQRGEIKEPKKTFRDLYKETMFRNEELIDP